VKFEPKTEKQLAEESLLPPGTYDFEVFDAEEKVSRNNNDMIVLKLFVFDAGGTRRIVTDWLLASVAHKLRHAAEAMGLLEQYEAGELTPDDFLGKTGKVKLRISKDATGRYPDQNSVVDYVREGASSADGDARKPQGGTRPRAMVGAPMDDEIPFGPAR
jgi:hypothetical protein